MRMVVQVPAMSWRVQLRRWPLGWLALAAPGQEDEGHRPAPGPPGATWPKGGGGDACPQWRGCSWVVVPRRWRLAPERIAPAAERVGVAAGIGGAASEWISALSVLASAGCRCGLQRVSFFPFASLVDAAALLCVCFPPPHVQLATESRRQQQQQRPACELLPGARFWWTPVGRSAPPLASPPGWWSPARRHSLACTLLPQLKGEEKRKEPSESEKAKHEASDVGPTREGEDSHRLLSVVLLVWWRTFAGPMCRLGLSLLVTPARFGSAADATSSSSRAQVRRHRMHIASGDSSICGG